MHRDLKPQNILFRPSGTPAPIDFGLVKQISDSVIKAEETISVANGTAVGAGTPGYSAPEQFRGEDITPSADIHALGVIAERCFNGKPPSVWKPIIRRATSSIPGERFSSVEELAQAIRTRYFRLLWPAVIILLAVAAAISVWFISAHIHRSGIRFESGFDQWEKTVETRSDELGNYSHITLDGDLHQLDGRISLNDGHRTVVEGPGTLRLSINGTPDSTIVLRRCSLSNTTNDPSPENSPHYILEDGSYLNLSNLRQKDLPNIKVTYDTKDSAVLFGGPQNSLRYFFQ